LRYGMGKLTSWPPWPSPSVTTSFTASTREVSASHTLHRNPPSSPSSSTNQPTSRIQFIHCGAKKNKERSHNKQSCPQGSVLIPPIATELLTDNTAPSSSNEERSPLLILILSLSSAFNFFLGVFFLRPAFYFEPRNSQRTLIFSALRLPASPPFGPSHLAPFPANRFSTFH